MRAPSGFRLRLSVPARAVEVFEAALQSLGAAVVRDADAGAEVPLDAYLKEPPEPAGLAAALDLAAAAAGIAMPTVAVAALPPCDWVAEGHKGLPPLRAGRFFVHGAHNVHGGHNVHGAHGTQSAGARPASAIAILVEAGQAFGTGHHESTQGCLLALDALARRHRPGACLDLGCGSGILAIAMAKLWRAPVLACDIDPVAVAVARENIGLNGVAPLVRAVLGDGAGRRRAARWAPYDLIAANILAGPLAAMAGDLRRALAPDGRLVLSGLLRGQAGAVLARCRARRLRLERQITLGDWVTLVLRG